MSWSWKIFSAFGIPVRLHISMLLLPVIAFTWVEGNSLSSWIVAGVLAVLLFASVIAHEFGHALMGRRFGVKTEDIVLTPIGGMARMRNIPTNPSQEIAIAIAGPLVSFAVALGAWLFVSAAPVMPLAPRLILGAAAVLYELNLTLALFNLIPALPMDGGRVFRGILSLRGTYPRHHRGIPRGPGAGHRRRHLGRRAGTMEPRHHRLVHLLLCPAGTVVRHAPGSHGTGRSAGHRSGRVAGGSGRKSRGHFPPGSAVI